MIQGYTKEVNEALQKAHDRVVNLRIERNLAIVEAKTLKAHLAIVVERMSDTHPQAMGDAEYLWYRKAQELIQ